MLSIFNSLIGVAVQLVIDVISTFMSLIWMLVAWIGGLVVGPATTIVTSIANAAGLTGLINTLQNDVNTIENTTHIGGLFVWAASYLVNPTVFVSGIDEVFGVICASLIIRIIFIAWAKFWAGS